MRSFAKYIGSAALLGVIAVAILGTQHSGEEETRWSGLPPVPADVRLTPSVAPGEQPVGLEASVWRADGTRPCMVNVVAQSGEGVPSFVGDDGVLTSASFASQIAGACLGRPAFLAEMVGGAPAQWHEALEGVGPASLLGVASHSVTVRELQPGNAVLELTVGEPQEAPLVGSL